MQLTTAFSKTNTVAEMAKATTETLVKMGFKEKKIEGNVREQKRLIAALRSLADIGNAVAAYELGHLLSATEGSLCPMLSSVNLNESLLNERAGFGYKVQAIRLASDEYIYRTFADDIGDKTGVRADKLLQLKCILAAIVEGPDGRSRDNGRYTIEPYMVDDLIELLRENPDVRQVFLDELRGDILVRAEQQISPRKKPRAAKEGPKKDM